MYYKILPTKEFSKDFQRLDKNSQLQIKKKVEKYINIQRNHSSREGWHH